MTGTAQKVDVRVVLAFWALIVAVYAGKALFTAGTTPLFLDTDDAMRLVVVRDFLAGQGWYDIVQHRLNVPFGAELHWSRLIDLPLAAILMTLELVVSPAVAETILGYLWPSLLLLVLMGLSARVTMDLVGPEGMLPALVLPALSPAVMAQFSPGRLDHHSVQIILALVMAWCTIRAVTRPRFALGAGFAAAMAVAIGTESLPSIAAAVLVLGVLWVYRPERKDALRWFGVAFGAATPVLLALTVAPDRWLTPMCDAISPVYTAAAVLVGIGFVVLSALPQGLSRLVRLIAGLVVGGVTVAILVILFPGCLGGPYAAVDPWLVDNWLSRILEARPVWESFRALPADTVAIALPAFLGLAVALWCAVRGDATQRVEWLVLALTLALSLVVSVAQVRGFRFAEVFAIPAAAWLIATARARYLASGGVAQIGGLVGAWLLSAGTAILAIGLGAGALAAAGQQDVAPSGASAAPATTTTATVATKEACLLPSAFDDLRGLPPERIMTPIDLGSHMLMETPHAVVAAPYHRNQDGVRDAFRFFNEPLADARHILTARGIGLVVTCPAMAEMQVGPGSDPSSFVALAAAGTLPSWLVDQSLPGAALRVYAVLPEQP